MVRFPTSPIIIDQVLQIKISTLKRLAYLVPGEIRSGTLVWYRKGVAIGSVFIWADLTSGKSLNSYVRLDYKYNGESRKYSVDLEWIPSNLGKGKIWHFRCPFTSKRCRILYESRGYFVHRDAIPNGMYTSQIRSKYERGLYKSFGKVFKIYQLEELFERKYFTSHYMGRPTKRYLSILNKIQALEQSLPSNFEDYV